MNHGMEQAAAGKDAASLSSFNHKNHALHILDDLQFAVQTVLGCRHLSHFALNFLGILDRLQFIERCVHACGDLLTHIRMHAHMYNVGNLIIYLLAIWDTLRNLH